MYNHIVIHVFCNDAQNMELFRFEHIHDSRWPWGRQKQILQVQQSQLPKFEGNFDIE